jgi:predicted DNA-binding protein
LIELVRRTESLAKASTNKTTTMTLKLPGELDRKLNYLSKRLNLSKPDTLLKILTDYVPKG